MFIINRNHCVLKVLVVLGCQWLLAVAHVTLLDDSVLDKQHRGPEKHEREKILLRSPDEGFIMQASSFQEPFVIRLSRHSHDSGTPWPFPQKITTKHSRCSIDMSDPHVTYRGKSKIVHFNIDRFRKKMKRFDCRHNDRVSTKLYIYLSSIVEDEWPHLHMNENYTICVRSGNINVNAYNVWGLIRALDTLSQIIYIQKNTCHINDTDIADFPRFPHRGVLMDTARHYLKKSTIILNLEAMAQNKMNVLHWHIVDDQSFPYESKVLPNLTREGAYSEHHVYTQEVMREIVEEARLRGIRVIPEFDTPGHMFSWGLGAPHLLTPCYNDDGQFSGYYGPINPVLNSTYSTLKKLFTEVTTVFPDSFIHLGGDEVPPMCWLSNPHIKQFMKQNNMDSPQQLVNMYERLLIDQLPQDQNFVVWQEVFDNGVTLGPRCAVQIWKNDPTFVGKVTSSGQMALFTSMWYMNNFKVYGGMGMDWNIFYLCGVDQSTGKSIPEWNHPLMIGGEAAIFAEYIDDDSIMTLLWPRASAVAERLWSHETKSDVEECAPRLEEQRCRMTRFGVPVGIVNGPGYCDHEFNAATDVDADDQQVAGDINSISRVWKSSGDISQQVDKTQFERCTPPEDKVSPNLKVLLNFGTLRGIVAAFGLTVTCALMFYWISEYNTIITRCVGAHPTKLLFTTLTLIVVYLIVRQSMSL